jgi:hypothetical protein
MFIITIIIIIIKGNIFRRLKAHLEIGVSHSEAPLKNNAG